MTDLFDMITRGVFDPRQAVRAAIALKPDAKTRVLMVLAAGFVQLAVVALAQLLGAPPVDGEIAGPHLGTYALALGLTLLTYAITVGLAHRIGARFGGTGDRDAVASAVAFQNLLVAMISPLFMLGLTGGALGGLGSLIGVALSFWYLGAAIAEAHGFRSTVSVVAAVAVVLGAVAMISAMLMVAFMEAPV